MFKPIFGLLNALPFTYRMGRGVYKLTLSISVGCHMNNIYLGWLHLNIEKWNCRYLPKYQKMHLMLVGGTTYTWTACTYMCFIPDVMSTLLVFYHSKDHLAARAVNSCPPPPPTPPRRRGLTAACAASHCPGHGRHLNGWPLGHASCLMQGRQ